MSIFFYLSLVPEALIASMLPPKEFGNYLAVGTKKRTRGQAIFFLLKDLPRDSFGIEDIEKKCVPHPDGEPKHSLYLSIYRVLEQTPLHALGNLYLVTPDGRVLELESKEQLPQFAQTFNMYQEICPVHPRIVSSLNPKEFCVYITDPQNPIHVPSICFVDLRLGELAVDPENGAIKDLPYRAIEHLRDCLIQLKENPGKHTKTVDRIHPQSFPFRTILNGLFVGGGEEMLYYPFPSEKELESRYYEWWRSASIMGESSF
jgi:hypothetical protein